MIQHKTSGETDARASGSPCAPTRSSWIGAPGPRGFEKSSLVSNYACLCKLASSGGGASEWNNFGPFRFCRVEFLRGDSENPESFLKPGPRFSASFESRFGTRGGAQ